MTMATIPKQPPVEVIPMPQPEQNEEKFITPLQVEDKAETTIIEQQITQPSAFMMQPGLVNEKQLLHLLQRTPKNHMYTRPAKGGGTWEYVTGTYVKKVLNYVFGWNWDFEVVSYTEKHNQIQVLGKLTTRGENNIAVVKMQFGRADIKYKKNSETPVDFGNDLKAATTDALKKCAAELGIASDIYGKNEFREVAPPPAKEPKQPPAVDPSKWRTELKKLLTELRENKEPLREVLSKVLGTTDLPWPPNEGQAKDLIQKVLNKTLSNEPKN